MLGRLHKGTCPYLHLVTCQKLRNRLHSSDLLAALLNKMNANEYKIQLNLMEEESRDGRAKKYTSNSVSDNNRRDAFLHIFIETLCVKEPQV